jgi:hypothetical protein
MWFPKLHLKLCVFLSLTAMLTSITSLLGCGGKPKTEASTQMPPSPSPSPGASIDPGTPAGAKTISHIEDLGNWQWCTRQLNGTACASGAGNAASSMTSHQSSPSQDGSSARFSISGSTGYSNALWWNSVANDSSVSHFTYDLWFYIDHPELSEALEFDVNQSFGGIRYTWGTECAFKDSHRWDIWDAAAFKWVPTSLPCKPFSANTWHHIMWQFERVNHQMHYISLTVDNNTMPVDIYKDPQTNWNFEDINVAFQLDGDIKQHPYNVWLDQVNLTMW